jgi:hypothetical protein
MSLPLLSLENGIAFEIILRVFVDQPVTHGVEVNAQFSAVMWHSLPDLQSSHLTVPCSNAGRDLPNGTPWRLILPEGNNRSDFR